LKCLLALIADSLILLLLVLIPASNIQAQEDIIVATGLPVESDLFKAAEEVLIIISDRMKREFKLISIPGKRASILLKNNEIHAEFTRVSEYAKKVPSAIKVAEPIIELSHYAYSIQKNFEVDGWGSLKPYRTVAMRGAWIIEIFMSEQNVSLMDSMDSAFKFLLSGRADIYVANSIQADMFLASENYAEQGIKRLEPAIFTSREYTFFAKGYPELAQRYELALKSMKADGSYNKILAKIGM